MSFNGNTTGVTIGVGTANSGADPGGGAPGARPLKRIGMTGQYVCVFWLYVPNIVSVWSFIAIFFILFVCTCNI